ncbi:acyl-CoA dehydrogenase family protein [Cumulibacter soli]|uniref:acyl-CoA dehydrogenase family protein n=1 Tax=Cumulibacter soli TaxID=2546344 RepID=UPI001068B750|nr:acyl-CoA dehydrogenase family protein [Cumulibacter soli]
MTISITDEHAQLRQYLNRFLGERYDLAKSRDVIKNGSGWQPDIWQAFASELGILGATFSAEAAGDDGGAAEALTITEALGGALVVEPYVETVVLAGTLVRELVGAQANDHLRAIAEARAIYAVGTLESGSGHCYHDVQTTARRDGEGWVLNGAKAVVTFAPVATDLLITARTSGARRDVDGISLFRIATADAPAGLSQHVMRTYDDRLAADLVLDGVQLSADALVGAEGGAWAALDLAVDSATAAVCSEAVGCMRKLVDDTVEYAKQREQFGKPIGSFQVLQHRMVDMYIQTEQASAAAELAFGALERQPQARAKAVSAAKVTVARAARYVGQQAVQLHGGMGMTEELAVGHYFKRLTAIESEFGTDEHHLIRYAAN